MIVLLLFIDIWVRCMSYTDEDVKKAIKLINTYGLRSLPDELRNKEFMLRCINMNTKGNYIFNDINIKACDVKIDYDVVLALGLQYARVGYRVHRTKEYLNRHYSEYLTSEEIDKLLTTLKLIE